MNIDEKFSRKSEHIISYIISYQKIHTSYQVRLIPMMKGWIDV